MDIDLTLQDFAHRGLWTSDGPPENSMAAFDAARDHGFGIELDVRLTADNDVVVFHDSTLDRMTGHTGCVHDATSEDLTQTLLKNSAESIPTLSGLVKRLAGTVPVLIELKTDGRIDGVLEEQVADIVSQAPANLAVMSFSEVAVANLQKLLPASNRGQLIEPLRMIDRTAFEAKIKAALSAGVDYLSVWYEDAEIARDVAGDQSAIIAWTVKTPEIANGVRNVTQSIIFEDLSPPLVRANPPG